MVSTITCKLKTHMLRNSLNVGLWDRISWSYMTSTTRGKQKLKSNAPIIDQTKWMVSPWSNNTLYISLCKKKKTHLPELSEKWRARINGEILMLKSWPTLNLRDTPVKMSCLGNSMISFEKLKPILEVSAATAKLLCTTEQFKNATIILINAWYNLQRPPLIPAKHNDVCLRQKIASVPHENSFL